MTPSLKLLTSTREARREAARGKLAWATRQFDDAFATCEQSYHALEQAKQWRLQVAERCTLGKDPAVRESLWPACTALIEARQQQFVQTQALLRQAQAHLEEQRQQLMVCERDMLRLEEWQQLDDAQTQQAQAHLESQQDDEVPGRRQNRWGAV